MNIELSISIDGINYPLNDELQSTVSQIVNSYIKQKISGVKEKKVKVPKDPNAPKIIKKHLTAEQRTAIEQRALQLQDKNKMQASKILMAEFGRPMQSMYRMVYELEVAGKAKFVYYDPKSPKNGNN